MSMPGLALEVLLGLVAGGMVDEGLQERLRDGVASRNTRHHVTLQCRFPSAVHFP